MFILFYCSFYVGWQFVGTTMASFHDVQSIEFTFVTELEFAEEEQELEEEEKENIIEERSDTTAFENYDEQVLDVEYVDNNVQEQKSQPEGQLEEVELSTELQTGEN